MSGTSLPPRTQPRSSLSPGLKVFLFVVLPVIVLVLIAFAAWGAFLLFGSTARVHLGYSVAAGSSVDVSVANASFDFRPGSGDRVAVKVTGTASGPEPKFTVDTAAGVTRIEGGCSRVWFSFCSLHIGVILPASAELSVESTNGRIAAERLTGAVNIGTTNGSLELGRLTGRLEVRTTNGTIRLRDASSRRVMARTTNGAVELAFRRPPVEVAAQSTNGRITIRVPRVATTSWMRTPPTVTSTRMFRAIGAQSISFRHGRPTAA